MNKYQEALDNIKNMGDKDLYNERHLKWAEILQEAIDKANKYDELQKVYFKNEPMESANLNARKLQELYYFNNKLVNKETPKKYKIKTDKDGRMIFVCPNCNNTLVKFWSEVETIRCIPYCEDCGQKLDWSDE